MRSKRPVKKSGIHVGPADLAEEMKRLQRPVKFTYDEKLLFENFARKEKQRERRGEPPDKYSALPEKIVKSHPSSGESIAQFQTLNKLSRDEGSRLSTLPVELQQKIAFELLNSQLESHHRKKARLSKENAIRNRAIAKKEREEARRAEEERQRGRRVSSNLFI